MILSTSYRGRTEIKRDLLAGFSAIDHRTSASLSASQIEELTLRLLLRLAALCSLHDVKVPTRLLRAVRESDLPFESISNLLDRGDVTEDSEISSRELQQELLHFSRIVDIGTVGFDAPVAGTKRLRKSHRLPLSLKVLSELMVVTRGRLAQRQRPVVAVPARRPGMVRFDVGTDVLVQGSKYVADHLLLVVGPRRRARQEIGFLFNSLLVYLPPVEAFTAVTAYLPEAGLGPWGELRLLCLVADGDVEIRSWSYDASTVPNDAFEAAAQLLPVIKRTSAVSRIPIGIPGLDCTVHDGQVVFGVGGSNCASARLAAPGSATPLTPEALAQLGLTAWDERSLATWRVLSIECGHIHLDRHLDVDQWSGARIGATVYKSLSTRQRSAPMLAPMMDDDHVMVALRPSDYEMFLRSCFPDTSFVVIPESSPIIRAIATILYRRLSTGPRKAEITTRGGNLFFRLPDGSFCELFESFDDNPVSGCVLFEASLLVYRSAYEAFDEYMTARFGLCEHIHVAAARVLDEDASHDTKAARIAELYQRYADVTDPHRPDPGFAELVRQVLDDVPEEAVHLNVLEDYYEVQQTKVRQLLAALDIPFQLVTLFFNTQTGRVRLDA
jgi:hypothetical protein